MQETKPGLSAETCLREFFVLCVVPFLTITLTPEDKFPDNPNPFIFSLFPRVSLRDSGLKDCVADKVIQNAETFVLCSFRHGSPRSEWAFLDHFPLVPELDRVKA